MLKKLSVALPTLAFLGGIALAQDAKTVLQNACPRQNFVVREMNGFRGEGDRQTPRPPRRVKNG
jgi:hypothetical protein